MIDKMVDATVASRPAHVRIQRFLSAPSPAAALREWFDDRIPHDKDAVARQLNRDVALIDALLNDQLNAIIHHPQFQKLEASWRGLHYLTESAAEEGNPRVKIRALNTSWKELQRDFEGSLEFDQSQLFKKIYENEFGMPGGEPYGALIADYEIHPRPSATHAFDDIAMLRWLSQVGAAAFCPIIANASPEMFELNQEPDGDGTSGERRRRVDATFGFAGIQYAADHRRRFDQIDYVKWRSFRDTEDSRFVALALPRVLMRLPYQDDSSRTDRFVFQEDVSGTDRRRYLWGGAAFAKGEVLIRAFAQASWLADIRGVHRDEARGGIVTRLPTHEFTTEASGIAIKSSTDVVISDQLEKELSDLGFLPLCDCKDTGYSAFYSSQSTQKPKQYGDRVANVNSQISSMLQYMLCVSRFAHYVKVLARDKVGTFNSPEEFERMLQNWIVNYVTPDIEASPDIKASRPLREAAINVTPIPGKPGAYRCTMHLSPHYELDEMHVAVRLVSDLTPPRP